MEMQSAESDLIEKPKARWLAREKESGRIYDWATIGSAVVLAGTLAFSYAMLSREAEPGSMLSPPQIALLLIANLIPAIALMVLLSRKIATGAGSGTGNRHGSASYPTGRAFFGHRGGADGDRRHLRVAAAAIGT